jgi:hypothetical protein
MAKRALTPGKALARERQQWVRERAQKELDRLRAAILKTRERRKRALLRARQTCALARERIRVDVKAFRSAEFKRIAEEVRQMRNAARAQCQARKHRVKVAGANAIERKRHERNAEARQQRHMESADRRARRQRTTYLERRQEDDGAVRSNLPRELVGVFNRVARHIKGSRYRTRTEAFLEWAQEHPEDVIAYQGDDTDREVARLIAERERVERQLAKTKPKPGRRRAAGEVPF